MEQQTSDVQLPKMWIWVIAHVIACDLVSLGGWVYGGELWVATAILVTPLAISVVQMTLLRGFLRRPYLWIVASVFGQILSFSVCIFGLVIGLGMGLLQTFLLLLSGFRQPLWWIPATGFGWMIAVQMMVICHAMLKPFFPESDFGYPSHPAAILVVNSVAGFVFGGITHLVLPLCEPPSKPSHSLP